MLGRGVAERLRSAPPELVWEPELRDLLGACDAVIANLECCISDRGRPTRRIRGKPFFFRAPPAAIDSLRTIGTRAVSLANNHALDYETEALTDTLALLDEAGIAVSGAGADVAQAREPAAVRAGSLTIGVAAVTDHPFEYAAGDKEPGVAWARLQDGTPAWLADSVAGLRRRCDRVLAFLHWGPNMTTGPARWQRDRARDLVAAGADLVAGHSAHVFHGVGREHGRPVLFDIGDVLDDYARDPVKRNDLGIAVLWHPDDEPEIELVGLRLDYARTGLADGDDAEWIAKRLDKACAELGTALRRLDEQRFAVVDPAGEYGFSGAGTRA